MPYIIDVASMDFPDGAQRFNWCSCQKPAALATGLGASLDDYAAMTPIVDWTFSDAYTGPMPAGAPASSLSTAVSSLSSSVTSLVSGNLWVIVLAALAWWWWSRRKGRR